MREPFERDKNFCSIGPVVVTPQFQWRGHRFDPWSEIPGSGRSAGDGNGKPLQDSCLESPVHRPRGCKESGHDSGTNTHTQGAKSRHAVVAQPKRKKEFAKSIHQGSKVNPITSLKLYRKQFKKKK